MAVSLQLFLQPAFTRHVQVVVRLVEQQHLVGPTQQRLEDQTLLLAAGQGPRIPPLAPVVGHAEGGHRALVPEVLRFVSARVTPVAQRLRVGHLRGLVVAFHDRQLGRVDRSCRRGHGRPGDRDEEVTDRPVVTDRTDELRHDAEAAAGGDRALVGLQLPGDQAHQRGLSGPVRPDQGHDRALLDPEAGVGQ